MIVAAVVTAAALGVGYQTWVWMRRRKPESASGRHVLITGGSEGIGFEVAKLCVQRGAKVTLVARSQAKLDAACKALKDLAPDALVCSASADVGDRAGLAAALKKAEESHGSLDICICAAGASIPKYFEELTQEDFDRMLKVNYLGVVNVAQVVLPGMVARDSGHFCAISSIAAAVPFVGYAAYAPAKAACRSLMDVLRNEYADTNVQFHVAFPPDTDTPGFAKENETKPYETSHIWPQCFNEVFPATQVATMLLDGVLSGDYFIQSPDLFGNLLVSRAWGHLPRPWPLLEACLAPIFVYLHEVMVWMADRAVRKGAHHKKGSSGESASSSSAAE
eukprot:TRINITY_DN38043_c0_g1_i1.p1 TRINITY_DN38043_c0_g1~~TRINITY_DN38043_c0_g1_i1.p1  ORF type:complete len:335 (+),score=73.80 TRINITY_DN38043_c0_g1_i1:102-1106(+)